MEATKTCPSAPQSLRRARRLAAIIPLTLMLAPPTVDAQTADQIASCAAVENDIARLQCYDALAEPVGSPHTSGSDAATTGNWTVQDETNPIDDTRLVTVALRSASGTTVGGAPIVLILRCQSGDTSAYINWQEYLGSDANVLTRVGTDEASTLGWLRSPDRQSTFAPGNNVEFIQRLLGADRLVAQITPYNANPIRANFDLAGIEDALAPLRETCGW